MNPLFSMFGQNNTLFPINILEQFNQFKSSFQGDPRQQVQNLLNNGRMTQEQFNYLSMMAQQFQQILNR